MDSFLSEPDYGPSTSVHPQAAPRESYAQEAGSGMNEPAHTDVFRYQEYRAYLRDRFAELQSRDPSFSQRGLARKAAIANPGFFNEVIKGRRRLSPAAAAKMATGLDLSAEEAEYFSCLVEFCEAREPRAKLAAGKRMLGLRNRKALSEVDARSSSSESLQGMVRESNQEWILRAAGIDPEGGENPTGPISEAALQGILEKLGSLSRKSDAAGEG